MSVIELHPDAAHMETEITSVCLRGERKSLDHNEKNKRVQNRYLYLTNFLFIYWNQSYLILIAVYCVPNENTKYSNKF